MKLEQFVDRGMKAQKAIDKLIPPKRPTKAELNAAAEAERETWEQCQMLLKPLKKAGNQLVVLLRKKGTVSEDEVLAAIKEWDAHQ